MVILKRKHPRNSESNIYTAVFILGEESVAVDLRMRDIPFREQVLGLRQATVTEVALVSRQHLELASCRLLQNWDSRGLPHRMIHALPPCSSEVKTRQVGVKDPKSTADHDAGTVERQGTAHQIIRMLK